jgi:hypothetical protein
MDGSATIKHVNINGKIVNNNRNSTNSHPGFIGIRSRHLDVGLLTRALYVYALFPVGHARGYGRQFVDKRLLNSSFVCIFLFIFRFADSVGIE